MKDPKQLTKQERERRLEFLRSFGGGGIRGGRHTAPVVQAKAKARITVAPVWANKEKPDADKQ